jgi:hypothetical protein
MSLPAILIVGAYKLFTYIVGILLGIALIIWFKSRL